MGDELPPRITLLHTEPHSHARTHQRALVHTRTHSYAPGGTCGGEHPHPTQLRLQLVHERKQRGALRAHWGHGRPPRGVVPAAAYHPGVATTTATTASCEGAGAIPTGFYGVKQRFQRRELVLFQGQH